MSTGRAPTVNARRMSRPMALGRTEPTTLDKANERLAERGLHLHPTKGWRKLNAKRDMAGIITGEMKQGLHGWNNQAIKRQLRSVAS